MPTPRRLRAEALPQGLPYAAPALRRAAGSLPALAVPPPDNSIEDAKAMLEALLSPRWSTVSTALACCASAAAATVGTALTFAAWVKRAAPPQLHYAETPENRQLIADMPIMLRSYIPNLLSWNKHLAGVFGYLKLPTRVRPHSTERVTMPDGGTVCLSWNSEPPSDGTPVVLLLPGINNDTSMPYVRHLMRVLLDEGHVVAALDWRGLGASGPLTATSCTPRPYCAACDVDIQCVLLHLRERLPSSPLCAIGFSLGGGMLLKYMGDSGEGCLLQAAMAVSPSLDFHANHRHSERLRSCYLPCVVPCAAPCDTPCAIPRPSLATP